MPPELDATVDSSTATGTDPGTGTDAGPSAGTLNTAPAPDVQPPFHEHPRFQELIGENRQLKAAYGELARRIEALQKARPSDQPPSEYVEAAEALLSKVLPAHPKLRALLDLADRAPALTQSVESLTASQRNGLLQAGRSQIASLAQAAKLPADETSLHLIEEMIAGTIRRMKQGEARFLQGDLSIIKEAFNEVESKFLAPFRREGAAQLATTKRKTGNLPPAPRGGLPGTDGPLKLEPGKEREFTDRLHKQALEMIRESGT